LKGGIIIFQVEVKSDILKEVLNVVATLVDEAKFNITEDGISLRAVDPAHVAMIDLKLKSSAFENFKASESELGIDISKMTDVLKLAKPNDVISITHDEEKNRLILKILNITRSMALVDTTGMAEPKVPNLSLPVKVVIKTQELVQGIKASESISDHISLSANSDGFELMSEGDTDAVNLKLSKDLLSELKCSESVKSLFSLDYFSNMVKSASSAESITMNLGTDFPVKIEFNIANDNGEVNYLLAPRIESE
jgi:proliferating cell nuclear antigen